MNLLRLLRQGGSGSMRSLFLGAAASSLGTTIVLGVVNQAAEEIAREQADFVDGPLLLAFVASILFYMWSESWMVGRLSADMEEAIDRLRMRLIGHIRHADLWRLECFGQSRLYETIVQNCQAISSNSQYLAQAACSVVLTAAIMIYIATISLMAFTLLGGFLGIAALIYYRQNRVLDERQQALMQQETRLFESISDLLDGFKEQRLNRQRSADLNTGFIGLSRTTADLRSEVHGLSWKQFVFGEMAFNLMLGIVVFVVPRYAPDVSGELLKISGAVLFMSAPIFGLMQSLAIMRMAEGAAGRMMDLEGELEALAEPGSRTPGLPLPSPFKEIRMAGVEYTFPAPEGERGFAVGPFDVSIRRGEVIFVTGGNGAGKSTFIKLLTGLYRPDRGQLLVDRMVVSTAQLMSYRALMAPIFYDFHLFARLYGISGFEQEMADSLMLWMEMEKVTRVEADRFAKIRLSTGQRKRLALVAAILEAKPVLILDEWAADQDPHFRAKFYREIVPELKRRGLTIIAVTHDDRYFDAADRRWHLEEGRLTEWPQAAGSAP
ncbi:ATP-binding cassette domain-containing protein [Azovibrio restrictus]|uniref:ATP-binding cassette domain-containing protein n=1 Tax=Azovibrio restrictus TaxID=146938 RepID=UPI000410580D|nr:ATP-binding cassette domain-containing protein [Azovibrio restrictus]